MTELRELTDAELDIVGGGAMMKQPGPQQPIVRLVEELIVDIVRVLESNSRGRGCNSGPTKADAA